MGLVTFLGPAGLRDDFLRFPWVLAHQTRLFLSTFEESSYHRVLWEITLLFGERRQSPNRTALALARAPMALKWQQPLGVISYLIQAN